MVYSKGRFRYQLCIAAASERRKERLHCEQTLSKIHAYKLFGSSGYCEDLTANSQRFERRAPNELWQIDFKSPVKWDAAVGLLSVLDDHSRYEIALRGTWSTKAEPVRQRAGSERAGNMCENV